MLMAYGGPDKLEDVPDYLLDVRSGRAMSQELVDEFVERYREIGGRSPILELTRAQAKGVEKALNNRKAKESGIKYTCYVGMRHWDPYIRDVVPQIVEDKVDKIVGVVMAPHYSKMSVGKYMEQLREGLEKAGSDIPVHEVHSWKDQPMFISGVSSRIRDALRTFPADIRKDVPIVFTAHSLPVRILEWGDPYPDELRVSVEMVADRVRQRHWRFAYQSQGASAEPWLGPEVEETLDELAAEGFKHVLMVPIGFVCDHVEILYDVDIEHKAHAEKLGMELSRIKSLNDGPMLCRAVAESVRKAHDPNHVSEDAEAEMASVEGD
ncbi:MAG: ferrochelatase [Sphaerobacteraceae bacterium]|nr:MAG: ferrochelatase [Sphaerobacteraceae bacterium]